eukprot:CAMPEP_0175152986 /NCGR_PEP_ID=MMETSP0087-20121206/19453_1 /TAXON_ID=136419 /ORGANISM="Unknown Unknown, Strain D1" /LENGTH=72 /DNA_ID=CAMNT_0016439549 /DNA_START=837 /DNA_END=1051 /DNA_ORIENTATION=+
MKTQKSVDQKARVFRRQGFRQVLRDEEENPVQKTVEPVHQIEDRKFGSFFPLNEIFAESKKTGKNNSPQAKA